MQLLVFRALWGMTGAVEEQIARSAAAGCDGVESFIGASALDAADFKALVRSHRLKLIMGGTVDSITTLDQTLRQLADYEPLKIGLHSGRASMSFDEGNAYFETLKVVADYSHWVNVRERLPDDQAEALDLANRRAALADLPAFTITPEYGPPPYQHTLPHTNMPVADNWEVCLWGMQAARALL